MPKTIAFLLIGLFFGTGLGFLLAAGSGARPDVHDHGPEVHDHAAHDHGDGSHEHAAMTEAGTPAPGLELVLHPDARQSRNLRIVTRNFVFDPEGVNGAHVPGRGHAHIWIDGVRIGRAYGPWFHLGALPVGSHELRVTLNANDHSQLATDGRPIEATATVVIE